MEWLGDIMRAVLEFFYSFLGDWGLAILALTVAIRMVLWPLTHKQTVSMKRMQELQPEIKKLQEKYKKKPEKLNKEMMDLYRKHGASPWSGCLPLLLQLPILIGLFRGLHAMEYPAGQGAFLWLPDLSAPDPLYILPVLAGVTLYVSQKQMTVDPQQNKIMAFMPLLIAYFASQFPSGVALYFVVSNLVGILQHFIIGRRGPGLKEELAPEKGELASDEKA